VIHLQRQIERDLAASLTALPGYRQARWRAVILYGMAGIGKTAMARTLTDDDQVKKAFRDGIAWVDGSRDPEEEVMRLCLGFSLERKLGERWIECWRRWTSAAERRLLLIVDDMLSAESLPPLIAGLGPQVVALITAQQGAEIRGEVERWLPAEAITEVGIHGLRPDEGRALVEAVIEHSLVDVEWDMVQEIGELIGWHPEALRLAGIESREIGWAGALGDLRAGRMCWDGIRGLVMRQWQRLIADHQTKLMTLIENITSNTVFTTGEAAQCWGTEPAIAARQIWMLEHCGFVIKKTTSKAGSPQLCVEPIISLVLPRDLQRQETKNGDGRHATLPCDE